MKIGLFHLPVTLPRSQAPRGPLINIAPMGLFALGELLERDGHEVEIVHVGVEQRLDSTFTVATDVQNMGYELVGFALHWHYQIGPVAEAIETLRQLVPEVPVVLGGITASSFACAIIENWRGVNFVVTGDAERGLRDLANHLSGNGPALEAIPNLVSRNGDLVERSRTHYVATLADFDALVYSRLDLLRHHEHYNAQFAESPTASWSHARAFYVPVGRGCSVDCSFCSGGKTGHRRWAGRQGVLFRSPQRVVDDVRQVSAAGIRTLCFCFDPPPMSEAYHLELFSQLTPFVGGMDCVFECYVPPSRELLLAMLRCFGPGRVRISLSPTVGDEALRAQLLGTPYANHQVERTLIDCQKLSINTTLYFALVPQETRDQLINSLRWQKELASRYDCRLICSPLEMEPAAPWAERDANARLVDVRRTFGEFVKRHCVGPTVGVSYVKELGYNFPDVDERMIRVASFMLEPRTELANALAYCGNRTHGPYALVAPGQLKSLLQLLKGWRPRSLRILTSESWTELESKGWLNRIAAELGPHVQVVPCHPLRLKHEEWRESGHASAEIRADSTMTVLHARDERAVERAFGQHSMQTPLLDVDTVVAEACRWAQESCPAPLPGLLAMDPSGRLRCCPSAEPCAADTLSDFRQSLLDLAASARSRRGCGDCPADRQCSHCLFPGSLGEARFCAIRRAWAASKWPAELAPEAAQPGTRNLAIGWDN